MKFYRSCCAIFAVIFSSISFANNCEVVGQVSDIVSKHNNNSVHIIRSACPTEERISAFIYQWIYGGDRIVIVDDTEVWVTIAKGEKKIFTQKTNDLVLYEQTIDEMRNKQNSFPGMVEMAIDIWKKLERQRKTIPYFNKVRGGMQSLVVQQNPLLTSGQQYLPADYNQIALLWKGGPATVLLTTGSNEVVEMHSKNRAYVVMKLPSDQTVNIIRLQHQDIKWTIKKSSTIPIPEGIHENDLTSPSSQLMRAIWILKEDRKEWQLFALSEIVRLSQMGIFSAEELWKAALSGELVQALQKN